MIGPDDIDDMRPESPMPPPEMDLIAARQQELHEAAVALLGIVEGPQGFMEHGTWRAERSNLRMQDTDEWVRFYLAVKSMRPEGEG